MTSLLLKIIIMYCALVLMTSKVVASDLLIEETAIITHVADGDTFDVRYSGDNEFTRIRL